ncbi:acyl carrier protein [Bradyrhizobium sp. USDA 4369]
MENDEIVQRLKRILVDDLFVADSPDDIGLDSALEADVGLDSVGFVELATLVGEAFNIEISDETVGQGHFGSLRQLSQFIRSQVASRVDS